MSEFFRFPRTPHLVWLSKGQPRDDKVLTPVEMQALLARDVAVEEKVDGANLGFSLAPDGSLRAQNRGQYLGQPYTGQFSRLAPWLATRGDALTALLSQNLMLFGEWCAAKHSLSYDRLPDLFVLFDVYDRRKRRFWSTLRRDALAVPIGLSCVPHLAQGLVSLSQLKELLVATPSRYRQGPLEGLVIRCESTDWCESRAKLVQADFTQAIDVHWRKRAIEWNHVQTVETTS